MKDLWQVIYDAAANEGSILHDDTVSAIERAMEAKLSGDCGQLWEDIAAVRMRRIFELAEKLAAISRQVDALEAATEHLARKARVKVKCGACGYTYGECLACRVGTFGTIITSAQCGGHEETPCAEDCPAKRCADALQTLKEKL